MASPAKPVITGSWGRSDPAITIANFSTTSGYVHITLQYVDRSQSIAGRSESSSDLSGSSSLAESAQVLCTLRLPFGCRFSFAIQKKPAGFASERFLRLL